MVFYVAFYPTQRKCCSYDTIMSTNKLFKTSTQIIDAVQIMIRDCSGAAGVRSHQPYLLDIRIFEHFKACGASEVKITTTLPLTISVQHSFMSGKLSLSSIGIERPPFLREPVGTALCVWSRRKTLSRAVFMHRCSPYADNM